MLKCPNLILKFFVNYLTYFCKIMIKHMLGMDPFHFFEIKTKTKRLFLKTIIFKQIFVFFNNDRFWKNRPSLTTGKNTFFGRKIRGQKKIHTIFSKKKNTFKTTLITLTFRKKNFFYCHKPQIHSKFFLNSCF